MLWVPSFPNFEAGWETSSTQLVPRRLRYWEIHVLVETAVLWNHIVFKDFTYRLSNLTPKAESSNLIYRGLLPQQDRAGALRTMLYSAWEEPNGSCIDRNAIAPGRQNMSEKRKIALQEGKRQ